MKYVIPIAISSGTAVKLLGTLPATASQTRNALLAKIDEILSKWNGDAPLEPQAAQRDAEIENSARKRESSAATSRPRKTTKKSDA